MPGSDSLDNSLGPSCSITAGEYSRGVGGKGATESLAVVKAGIKSVATGRHVEVAEILAGDE